MVQVGANLPLNEGIQTRVLQAVSRCNRWLNDCAAVVITGENLLT